MRHRSCDGSFERMAPLSERHIRCRRLRPPERSVSLSYVPVHSADRALFAKQQRSLALISPPKVHLSTSRTFFA